MLNTLPNTNTFETEKQEVTRDEFNAKVARLKTLAPQEYIEQLLAKINIFDAPKKGSAHFNNQSHRDVKAAKDAIIDFISDRKADGQFRSWQAFAAAYKGRVQQDEWTGTVYHNLNGKWEPTGRDDLLTTFETAIESTSLMTNDVFRRHFDMWIAKHSYNPVKRYLMEVADKHEGLMEGFDQLAAKLFGANDPMSQEMLVRWLVGAVDRALNPGCQMDYTLVLKGQQGEGKTKFLSTLGGEYFVYLKKEQSELEIARLLQNAWLAEMGELEGFTSKKDVESLKNFLTATKDDYRKLYKELEHNASPRHCVFAGTCNSEDIFRDTTGNRRFWLIPVTQEIPITWVQENRDLIWASAYHLYRSGYKSWSKDLERRSEVRNKQYQVSNEFHDKVAELVKVLESKFEQDGTGIAIKVQDLMQAGLGIPLERQKSSGADRKVAQALKELGYERKKRRVCKIDVWVYQKAGFTESHVASIVDIENALKETFSKRAVAVSIEATPVEPETKLVLPEIRPLVDNNPSPEVSDALPF